ncbi:hypothetical protein PF008_g9958 [Phytophthora fragariae]|uniref:Crinkler effector protein N-terminal domain-containing protein n=1 Tax=Phytophthora fragariae TaxID=53985 RepID=A0A6G0RWS2_9STRA|nr:hypothetical protein PF008_g9958 [Phytophthora fragariae]
MTEVELGCAVYGEGSVFPVKIALNAKVSALQKAIFYEKRYNQQRKLDPSMLTLYLARKTEGGEIKWLKDDDNLANFLRGGISTEYAKMHSTWILDEDYLEENFQPGRKEIHVLVELPTQETDQRPRKKARLITAVEHTKLDAIAQVLQIEQWQDGGLELGIRDIEPDFPEYFYVRKETLDIFKIFRRQQEENRSVVFVGTPGVGKSMLVVLFAFYMALRQQKRVVLLRQLKQKGFTMLYLDPVHQQYWREEEANIADLDLLKHRDFKLCLDGFLYDDIKSKFGRLARFQLLATSAQYKMKDDDIEVLRKCIVPFWSKADLSTIGMHHQWAESDINDRFYFSGGSLYTFLAGKDFAKESINLAIVGTTAYVAELVSTQYRCTSVQQVDRLRMTTIPAQTSIENDEDYLRKYVNCGEWVCGITSQYALRKLGKAVEPSYYEKLWCIGRKIGDDALMEIAFENYVHSMARDGKKIELRVRPYDRKKQQQHTYLAVEFKANSYRNEGRDAVECEAIMQQLTGIDYWYPIDRGLVTTDSVAKLSWGAEHDAVGLIQITKFDTHKIDTDAIDKYASLVPGCARYIALVPDKETCDKFRLDPADPPTKVPLDVACIATWNL